MIRQWWCSRLSWFGVPSLGVVDPAVLTASILAVLYMMGPLTMLINILPIVAEGKTALAREAADWWLRTGHFETAVFCSFETKAGAERVVQLIGGALEGEDFSNRLADAQWEAAVGRA